MTNATQISKLGLALLTALGTGCVVGEASEAEPAPGTGLQGTGPAAYRVIYAAGVNNAAFGDDAPIGSNAFDRTNQTRDALRGWIAAEIARGRLAAGFADAPISLVGNRGTGLPDGVLGLRDDVAVAAVTGKLARYRADGIDNVLVVSHSNGVITTHAAYQRFVDGLTGDGADMCIQFQHTQAAGSQLSDFVSLEPRYFDGSTGVSATFRFTYNREDWMTFDPYGVSTVGRRESAPWVERVVAMAGEVAEQDVNPANERSGGGGGHDQVGTLTDLGTSSIDAGYGREVGRTTPACP